MNISGTQTDFEPMRRSLRALSMVCWGAGGVCLVATLLTVSPVMSDATTLSVMKPTSQLPVHTSLNAQPASYLGTTAP